LLTVVSGLSYFWKTRHMILDRNWKRPARLRR
jgi:hypothetical protein